MSDRPPILDDLGRELLRAARHHETRGGASRLGRVPRAVVVGLLALLGLAAVAAAASLVLGRDDPIPIVPAGEVPVELQPVAGSARLSDLDVRDPDGGPPWDVRTSRSKTGAVCATVGQVYEGEFGLLGLDRLFRPLPAGAADTCGAPQPRGATLAGARAFGGGGRLSDLTVVSGVAAANVRGARVIARGRSTKLRLSSDHAFLAVLRGRPEELLPRLVLTEASGARSTLRFADIGQFTAPDPSGESPWKLEYNTGKGGLRCVRPERVRGPGIDYVYGAKRCGRPAEPFVAIRRFVPEPLFGEGPGEYQGYRWWSHPARTLVWGATPRATDRVVLTGAGPPRALRVDTNAIRPSRPDGVAKVSAGRGGFLAVLDGHVDPRRLGVTVNGRRLDPRDAYDGAGRPIDAEPVPAWRSVNNVMSGSQPPRVRALAGSSAISGRAADPNGDRPWALRSWQVRLPTAAFKRAPQGLATCFAIGIEQRGRLVAPLPGGKRRLIETDTSAAPCFDRDRPSAAPPAPDVLTFVDDATSVDPKPLRVVVGGLLGERARSAQLLGAGPPRDLTLGAHGSYLIVLGPEHAGANFRVREQREHGASRRSRPRGAIPGERECRPLAGQSVRVADPGGGPPWTTGRGRAGDFKCRYTARVVIGHLGSVDQTADQVTFGFTSVGILLSRNPRPRKGNRPLVISISSDDGSRSRSRGPAPRRAPVEIARRTVPGRTVLTGSASAEVQSITLRTPRDIRTLRPGPSGLFMAVYDGIFYDGEVRADAHMRDGRTVTQTFPAGWP